MKLAFWFVTLLVFFAVPGLAKTLRLEVPKGTAQIIFYDQEGKVLQSLEDLDHDGYFEQTSIFKNGRLLKTIIDKNHNRIPEETIIYDLKGRPSRALFDRNEDKKPDKWQLYQNGRLKRVEEDRDFDGQKDLISEFNAQGQVVRILRDEDHDGFFEIEEKFCDKTREVLTFKALKPKGRVLLSRAIYVNGKLSKRFFDKDQDGVFEIEELFRPDGTRCLLFAPEKHEAFFYVKGREPALGFRDVDKDGLFDHVFSYKEKRWLKITPIKTKDLEMLCTLKKEQDVIKYLEEETR